MHRPRIVVVAPIAPSATGNGLAMRVHLLVAAAAVHHDVVVVVVPVAGSVPGAPAPDLGPGVEPVVWLAPTVPGDRAPVLAWLADPVWRPRLDALAPIPDAVAAAPPTRVPEVLDRLGGGPVAAVLACRLSTAPLALAVAERLGVPLVVDADDDDEAFHRRAGDHDAADRWGRVAALCLPAAHLVLVASPAERSGLARRHDLGDRVVVARNAVGLPPPTAPPPPGAHRLLFVGNLTYAPNVAGVRWFVHEVLPLLPAPWTVDLVGSPAPAVAELAGERVTVTGWVPDLADAYAAASVVVVPLLDGSGTRIKVLEAFAHGRPVVATTLGAAGLGVRSGEHLLLADDPVAFAGAVVAAAEPDRAGHLVAAARRLAADAYAADEVAAELGDRLADGIGRTAWPKQRTTGRPGPAPSTGST